MSKTILGRTMISNTDIPTYNSLNSENILFFPLKVGTDGDYEASNRTKKKKYSDFSRRCKNQFVCVCDVNYMCANYCMDQKSKYLLICSGEGKKSCFIFK